MLSIITINFNNVNGLKQTVESVLSQTLDQIEYIIIDGGSTDGSVEIIKGAASKINYWLSEPDKGVYDAMNKGIKKATGDYLLFLNSGDFLVNPGVLKAAMEEIALVKADVFYGDCIRLYPDSNQIYKNYPVKLSLPFFRDSTLNHQSSFIARALFDEIGLYNERYKICSDYEFFLRLILRAGTRFHYLNMPIAYFEMSGLSVKNQQVLQEERYKIWNEIVPEPVSDLFAEYLYLKRWSSFKIIKYASKVNHHWQELKKVVNYNK